MLTHTTVYGMPQMLYALRILSTPLCYTQLSDNVRYPLIPTGDIGRLLSQSQTDVPTLLITSRTSSPSGPLCTMIGLPASPPSLTCGTSGS
jgi:hypothetical protein